jgi:hypothetical protein
MFKHLLTLVIISTAFLAGCAGTNSPNGHAYEDTVAPGKVKLLNLTGASTTDGAAEVYFSSSQRTEAAVVFRDRLVAIQVDGKDLPGVDRGNKITYPTGYQAIALTPGVHSISYCHMTRSALATGVWGCNLKINDFNFEPNARYMVQGNVKVSTGTIGNSITQTANVKTGIYKLD